MIRFANPTRFLVLAGRMIPILAGTSIVFIAAGVYAAFFRCSCRLPAGGDGSHHVYSCAIGVAFDGVLFVDGAFRARDIDLAASSRGCVSEGTVADRDSFHLHLSRDRVFLGASHVGHMVGVGCETDLRADPVSDVLRYHGVVECV